MKTDQLIASLAQDAKPVRRLPSPLVLAFALTALAVLASMTGAWLMGMRDDLPARVGERHFIMLNSMLLMTLLGLALALGTLAIPGRRRYRLQIVMGAVFAAALLAMFLMRWPWLVGMSWGLWFTLGLYCTFRTILLGALPAAFGVWLHRHGAPTQPSLSGGLIGGAAGSQGANAMGWACEIDEPLHVLIWHFVLPTAVLALAGVWAGRRWLRW